MLLTKAIDILKTEQKAADAKNLIGDEDIRYKEFSQAVDVVTEFIDDTVCILSKLGRLK